MRITGGQYRGRILKAPKDNTIRPTADKTRQAIFNILNARGLVENAAVLDAFCGTGALGLESLSWGALCCTFIDKNHGALDLCRENYAALKSDAKCSFVLSDAQKLTVNQDYPYDLVFLDPPYRQNLIETTLPVLWEKQWLKPNAHIVAEAEKTWDANVLISFGYEILLVRDYSDTRIVLAQKIG